MSATPSVTDEKQDLRDVQKKRFSFKKSKNVLDEKQLDDASSESTAVQAPSVYPPVPFTQLFRFHTVFDLCLNALGVVCAAGSGAAQPLMTLMFGNLTLAFVQFGTAVQTAFGPGAGPAAMQEFNDAADAFKRAAADDALYLFCIGIALTVTTYTFMLTWTYTGEVNAKRIREQYLKAILRQDIAFFDKVGAGEVATRIQTDTHLVQQGISEKVALTVSFLGSFLTGFILAYVQSWKLSLAISSIVPCIAITGAFMNIFMSKYKLASLGHIAEGGSVAEEVIGTIRTTQAFGSQSILSEMYNVHITNSARFEKKMAVVNGLGLAVFFFVMYSSYGLAFSFGTTLLLRGEINVGIIVNVFLSIMIGSFSLVMLAPEMQAIANGRGAAAKLFTTIDRTPPIDSGDPSGLKPEKVAGEITLHNIKFNYPARPDVPILKDLSISFAAGKTSALVGASGSGKSTIVSLAERFYDPLEGQVRLDGVDLKDLNLKWLRSQIGLVSQEPILFATTIRGNVEHGFIGTNLEHASDEERFAAVKEACTKANASGFINKLPLGYDTMVGERGFLLSGGQKQRIAIARAIVSDPPILLLDEATSALDTQSEGIVQNALDKAAAGRTTITIAHRLSTIKDADQIYVMGDGQVLEQGTHAQLLADPEGPYARLVQAQRLREAEQRGDDLESNSEDEEITAMKQASAMEIAAEKEDPLGRANTSRSLASEVLEQRRREQQSVKEKQYGTRDMFMRMGSINKESIPLYIIGCLAAVCTGMVYPAFGIVYAHAIQDFQMTGQALRVAADRSALWLFLIAIVSTICIAVQNFMFNRAAAGLTEKLRKLSFKAILRQDIAYFDVDKHSTGALTSDLSDGPQKVSGLAGVTLGAMVQSIVTVIGGSAIGLAYGWKLALVAIACIPLVIGAGYIRLRVVVLKDQTNRRAHEDSAQLACEAAGAIRTVASLTREDDCCQLYSTSLEGPLRVSNRSSLVSTGAFALSQGMVFFVLGLVFWYGSILVARLELDTLKFFVCVMSVTFGSVQAGNVFTFVPDISESSSASNNILRLLDSVPEIDAESSEGKALDKVKGRIEFKNVHFRYPTRQAVRVLRDFSLTVEPGTHVALVGASGCGKSTVIQLVERFYDPLHGEILIDDMSIDELNVQDYRKHIALVSQEPTLYAGTIRFNILLGAIKPLEDVTQEELEAACRDANILDFITSLPDGFDTEVGGKGSQLSGGQKQRIAIARALLRNPTVLLLDEATSALDGNSERVVQDALDRAAKGRTTISIAHRLSTIQQCDKIHFVQEGRIVESGTHDELTAKRGLYSEYVLLQDLSAPV